MEKVTLEIEDTTDEITRDAVLEFKQVFEQLINHPDFDISRVNEIHYKTWEDDLCKIEVNDIIQETKSNSKKSMDSFLAITKYLKYLAYKKYKRETIYDYGWKELPIGDYYIDSNDGYYTISLSSDIDSFGYNTRYFRYHYDCGESLLFCNIEKFNGKIGSTNVKKASDLSFIYDVYNKKVLDILGLSIFFENSKEKYVLSKKHLDGAWGLMKQG